MMINIDFGKYEMLSIGKCLFFSFKGVLKPLVRLKTLLGIISIIWQSMGSWGAILIDSMNDNFLCKYRNGYIYIYISMFEAPWSIWCVSGPSRCVPGTSCCVPGTSSCIPRTSCCVPRRSRCVRPYVLWAQHWCSEAS